MKDMQQMKKLLLLTISTEKTEKMCVYILLKEESLLLKSENAINKLCTPEQRVSFNDYLMGTLSVAFDKWYKAHEVNGAKQLLTFCSVNTRSPPKTFEDISIQNDSVGVKFLLPMKDNLPEAMDA